MIRAGFVCAALVASPAFAQSQSPATQFVRVEQVESYYCYQNAATAIRSTSSRKIVATVTVTVQGGPPAPSQTITLAPAERYTLGWSKDDRGGRAVFAVSDARYAE